MKITLSHTNPEGGWTDVEVTIATIGKFVPAHEFDARWAMFFRDEIRGYDTYLPTEILVRKPELVQPRRGRIFKTNLYLKKGFVFTYERLRKHHEKLGNTMPYPDGMEEVVLVEVYANHGDDGHINYELVGYRFVGEKGARGAQRVARHDGRDARQHAGGPHVSTDPPQGPTEPLLYRAMSRWQVFLFRSGKMFLEQCQHSISRSDGNSFQRTALCMALEKLHNIEPDRSRKSRRTRVKGETR